MNLQNKWASDLLSKDRQKVQTAIDHILNTPDIDAWKCLIESSDYIFSYIKDRIGQNIAGAINSNNVENIFPLLKYHSPDWDYYIAEGLKNNSNEDINTRMYDILNDGEPEEKAYAAKYFCLVGNPAVNDVLFQVSKEEFQPLKNNAAEALGVLGDSESYNYYLERLNSDDDWQKVESAEFLSRYGNKDAVKSMLIAMSNSGMAEYIAGEVLNLVSMPELLDSSDWQIRLLALDAFDSIISSMPEVWSLSSLVDFQIYESLESILNLAKENPDSDLSGKYALILLKIRAKVCLFTENSQYTYDEEKTVLGELEEICHLLKCEEQTFWDKQVEGLNNELYSDNEKRKLSVISLINELELKSCSEPLLKIVSNPNESEQVLCETVLALCKLDLITQLPDQQCLVARIKDKNLLAVVQNSLNTKV